MVKRLCLFIAFLCLLTGSNSAIAEKDPRDYVCFLTKYVTIHDDVTDVDWPSGKVFSLKISAGNWALLREDFFKLTFLTNEAANIMLIPVEHKPEDFVSLGSNPALRLKDGFFTYIATPDDSILGEETHVIKAVCRLLNT